VTAEFAGQTAVVTGGTTGIGRVVVDQLAAAGARVVISGRDPRRGQAASEAVTKCGGKADFVAADLAVPAPTSSIHEKAAPNAHNCAR
jgi:NAD(P)-dependent dehydrogenase (short-subunit alcohol dehydrogenase family)